MNRDSIVPTPLQYLPWGLLALVVSIAGFGLVVLYSAAGASLTPWAMSQGIRFLMFVCLAILISWAGEERLKKAALPTYAVLVLLLLAVELFGFVGGGSRRWLDLGFIRLQPSELMKPVIVLAVARFYDLLPASEIRRWSAIWPPALLIGVPFLLVLVQPDLGTATMIFAGGVTVAFLAGLPLRLFGGAALALAAAFPIGLSMMHGYQRDRIEIFLNPESDPLGTGYHIIQSKIAIGSGGIFGKGFLGGTQSHLDYLPERHTDFVFATMAEEWGLLGGIFLISAFMLVIRWGMGVAGRAKSRFARLTAAGLATTIVFYVAINLAELYAQRQFADLLRIAETIARQGSSDPALWNIMGAAHAGLRHYDRAVTCYEMALEIEPGAAGLHHNLGMALRHLGRPDVALASFRRAAQLQPDRPDFLNNLGNMAQQAGELDEAIAAYGMVLAIRPDHHSARAHRLHLLAQICDWDAIEAERAWIPMLGIESGAVSPFTLIALDDSPARQRRRAEAYVATLAGLPARPVFKPSAIRPERLRIGYFSADFHDHATLRLMAGLFEQHDRDRFEIIAYCFGPDHDDAMRRRLIASVDAFHDIGVIGDEEAAARARADRIDIAIDINGITRGARPGIFASGAAPVQIGYLGYAGTMGAPILDYLIADHVVIPDRQRDHYAERLIYLPHSYQVNDDRRAIADQCPSRAQMGLPEDAFVFCNFNSSYKITAQTFDIWMRLLVQLDGSVLWLLGGQPLAMENLRREAGRRGVAADRLIFADALPNAEHLARHRLADLFLDSFNCNAHTTASDALWAGLPVLTLPGESFPARVGASLLTAIGLPELIASSPEDYEAGALDLARDPAKLNRIRATLTANRLSYPLFRTEMFTRDIERAYDIAWARWQEGKPPADIDMARIAPQIIRA